MNLYSYIYQYASKVYRIQLNSSTEYIIDNVAMILDATSDD